MQTKLHSMLKLSIIVPVYNVEPYIRPCFESLFNQDLDDNEYEVIIVNDGSTDKSIGMIADIISQHNNVTIIDQENQGVSVARNNGIKIAKGEYIFMPDPDDMLFEKSVRPLLYEALDAKVDIIVADFIRVFSEGNKQLPSIQQKQFSFRVKTGNELLLEDLNPNECYVWRSLFRKQFLNNYNIRFIPGIRYQDVPFIHECYIKAKQCIRANWYLNIYRVGRPGAATESFNEKKASDFVTVIANTWKLTHIEGISREAKQKLNNDIFTNFSRFCYLSLYAIKDSKYQVLLLKKLKKEVPDIFFTNGIKQIIHSLLFRLLPNYYFVFLNILNNIKKNNRL